ncbi:hypothetical protein ATPR_3059 [Acetobacter tropicalis NBRC 101654]|uniref:Uncharacterized protein n=1 Tax=Acetobacter tropicalis NBRC 101654 TaxID=749388 RepID=F7VI60_9PROT|nr:hypothetical protein ATPR_3059 [Acetobacter tropicalis NBRC 101654]
MNTPSSSTTRSILFLKKTRYYLDQKEQKCLTKKHNMQNFKNWHIC